MSAKLARYLQIERDLQTSGLRWPGDCDIAVSLARRLDAAGAELDEEERRVLARRRNGPRPGDRAYRAPG